MEKSVPNWTQVTKNIYTGVLLYQIANVLYAIISPIKGAAKTAGAAMSFMSTGTIASSGPGFWGILMYILLAAIIVGYFLFLKGLGEWAPMLSPGDAKAVKQVRTGVILGLVATVIAFIPVIGWFRGIINIIAFIMMLLGYNALKNSSTFPPEAAKGASSLFIAMILSLVGAVIGFIPLIGGFIEMVLDIVAFFMILSGWGKIKNTPEPKKA